jgi:hypothetical protein
VRTLSFAGTLESNSTPSRRRAASTMAKSAKVRWTYNNKFAQRVERV